MDSLNLYGDIFTSRFLLGTALYPSPHIMQEALKASQTQIITVSLRRENSAGEQSRSFFDFIKIV